MRRAVAVAFAEAETFFAGRTRLRNDELADFLNGLLQAASANAGQSIAFLVLGLITGSIVLSLVKPPAKQEGGAA